MQVQSKSRRKRTNSYGLVISRAMNTRHPSVFDYSPHAMRADNMRSPQSKRAFQPREIAL
eukprot:scaffold348773_cov37-Prasinocladus_malaysianus.AAC.1